MKATLEFDLPEEDVEFREAVDAPCMARALRKMFGWLRTQRKYNNRETVGVEEVEEQLRIVTEGLELW